VNGIRLALHMDQWRALVNTKLNLGLLYNVGNSLTN